MLQLITRYQQALLGVILFLFSLQLMAYSVQHPDFTRPYIGAVSQVLSPLQQLQYLSLEPLRELYQNSMELFLLREKYEALNSRYRNLELERTRLLELEEENKRLSELLNFKRRESISGIAARVIARNPGNFQRTIELNIGAGAGIEQGMAVVSAGSIVGQITVVSKYTSKVLLINDSSSAVDALTQRTRAPGSIEGLSGGGLSMRYVLRTEEIKVGDRVIASGLDGVYPKGVLVGVITDIKGQLPGKEDSSAVLSAVPSELSTKDSAGAIPSLFYEVEIEPAADLSRIEEVLVVFSKNPESTDSEEVGLLE